MEKIILYGTIALSKMIIEDSKMREDLKIVAMAVDRSFYKGDFVFMGVKTYIVDDLASVFEIDDTKVIVISPNNSESNRLEEMIQTIKKLGFTLTNYISEGAVVSSDFTYGTNNIIFQQTYLGPSGKLGSNNIIRQKVYLGHDFLVGDNNIFSPSSTVAGECNIGNNCYFGIGSNVIERLSISDYSVIGAGAVVVKNTEAYSVNMGVPSKKVREVKSVR